MSDRERAIQELVWHAGYGSYGAPEVAVDTLRKMARTVGYEREWRHGYNIAKTVAAARANVTPAPDQNTLNALEG